METVEERLKALEEEFYSVRDDLQRILLDIRTYLMEALSPLRDREQDEDVSQRDEERG